MIFLEKVHRQWLAELEPVLPIIEKIERELSGSIFQPLAQDVLRVLELPLHDVRVVIFGQDPYPGIGEATGLAFSIPPLQRKFPRSLQNIFLELHSDLGCTPPLNGDLSQWANQGVALVNRTLTGLPGARNAHSQIGWAEVSNEIARILGKREVVAILWGKSALELMEFFRPEWIIASAHPSPLSARRGFFGSKPFSKANQILLENGFEPVDWCNRTL